MLDATSSLPGAAGLQRASGAARVVLRGGRIAGLRQEGSAKAMLPTVRGVPEVVFLNTAGGLAPGDSFRFSLDLEGRAVATTQTAERAYRAVPGAAPAAVEIRHRVAAGGFLDWLPQETILYQGAALARRTRIDLEPGAGCLSCETIVLGRAAMGETVTTLSLSDRREVWRGGRPVFVEPFALDGALLAQGGPALLEARAFATLLLVSAEAETALGPVRAALGVEGVRGAASAFDGKLVVRLAASDGWPLRRQIAAILAPIRRAPLPRVWQLPETCP